MLPRLRLLVSAVAEGVTALKNAWRRSLQLRVVVITLASSGTLVLTFGVAVTNMITSGLFARQKERAVAQVDAGSRDALGTLGVAGGPRNPTLVYSVRGAVGALATRASASNAEVAILPGQADMALTTGHSSPNQTAHQFVPASLRAAVARQEYSAGRYTLDLGQGERLYLVVGRQLRPSWDGMLELY
jgi:two-component system sensor histidine kinase MtrB